MHTPPLNIAMFSLHSSPLGPLGALDTGGMSVYIRETAGELGQMGHRVDIFTRAAPAGGEMVVPLAENARLVHLRSGRDTAAAKSVLHRSIAGFYREVESFRSRHLLAYDLIHSHYWLSGSLGEKASEGWQRPHVITFHTLGAAKNLTGLGRYEPAVRVSTEKRLAATCERILSPTTADKSNLVQLYGAADDKIAVVPCGVNLSRFRPFDAAGSRRRLDFARNESIVLYVGRFEPVKGIDRLLPALTHLRHVHPLRLVLVGGDGSASPATQRLRNQARDLGLQKIVTFAGRIDPDRLPLYYSAADVLVVPSYYESFGLVGLEALACGTPVVATPVGAMASILQPGRTGRVVTGADPRSLAGAIEGFLPGAGRKRLSAAAIRASVLNFGWPKVAAALAQEYTALCEKGAVA
jgi:D-inositol-3-phosphate glycosyltransferase